MEATKNIMIIIQDFELTNNTEVERSENNGDWIVRTQNPSAILKSFKDFYCGKTYRLERWSKYVFCLTTRKKPQTDYCGPVPCFYECDIF